MVPSAVACWRCGVRNEEGLLAARVCMRGATEEAVAAKHARHTRQSVGSVVMEVGERGGVDGSRIVYASRLGACGGWLDGGVQLRRSNRPRLAPARNNGSHA